MIWRLLIISGLACILTSPIWLGLCLSGLPHIQACALKTLGNIQVYAALSDNNSKKPIKKKGSVTRTSSSKRNSKKSVSFKNTQRRSKNTKPESPNAESPNAESPNAESPNANSKTLSSSNSDLLNQSYGTPFNEEGTSTVKLNVTAGLYPGVYAIIEKATGKSYFGETDCLFSRLSHHKKGLENRTHECAALQEAWNKAADPLQFEFTILEYGLEWGVKTNRLAKEKALIKANADNCFNTLPGTLSPRGVIRPVVIDGVRYNSTRDAARQLNRSRAGVIRSIRDPNRPECYATDTEPYGTIPVFVQIGQGGKEGPIILFPSMRSVVQAGFATSSQMVRRRIQNASYPGWRYAAVDSNGRPIRRPYVPKPGEITYENYLAQLKSGSNNSK